MLELVELWLLRVIAQKVTIGMAILGNFTVTLFKYT